MRTIDRKEYLWKFSKHGLFPAIFYFLFFCLLSYPLILNFSTQFFTDSGDGLMNVWNLWWVNTAITHPTAYPSLWYTNLLHWPFGTTLLGQTLNPFNGLIAVPLLRFMSLVEIHNVIVIFSFVTSGVAAYWLSYYLTKSCLGSLVAGYIFTFSSYHFAHYSGHLNLISLEWIPLFVLCWYILINDPSILMAIASAVTLWLVLFCDYYYFFFCILAGALIAIWIMVEKRNFRLFLTKKYLLPVGMFVGGCLLLTGPIILPLMYISRTDPFLGAHNPLNFSLDLFALFVPGGHWHFGQFTEFYWSKLPVTINESSVYLGFSVVILLGYLWLKRRGVAFIRQSMILMWFFLLAFFFFMALGPSLQIGGRVIYDGFMPYIALEKLLPFLKLSGVPLRMVAMITLIVSVLSSMALEHLLRYDSWRSVIFAVVILILLFVEYLPGPLPSTSVNIPGYVTALADLPNDGGVLDQAASTKYLQLYYQTQHHKPLVFGYLARFPSSIDEKERGLTRAINRDDYAKLWDTYRIRYIVTSKAIEDSDPYVSITPVYQNDDVKIYRLECRCEE